MAKRTPNQFFEIFRRPHQERRRWWSKGSEAPDAPSGEADAGAWPGSPLRARASRSGRFSISLRREAVIAGILVFVGLIVASYLWGRHRGERSAAARQARDAALIVREPAADRGDGRTSADTDRARGRREGPSASPPVARSAPSGPFVTLRIISTIPLQNARTIRDDLRAMGYNDVFVYRPRGRSGYTVNVGRFRSARAPEARALKEKLKRMEYRNRRLFESCYFQNIDNSGRTVQ